MNKRLKDFLQKQFLAVDQYSHEELIHHFIEDMQKGLKGEDSSFQMLPAHVPILKDFPLDKEVAIIDAGGTNFRVGSVKFNKEKVPSFDHFEKHPMPGTQGSLNKEDFFDALAKKIHPLLVNASALGFCFSYPVKVHPNGDGELLFWSKEIQAPEVVGELIVENLISSLKKLGLENPPPITLLNDSTATLLALFAEKKLHEAEPIAFILGTGTNSAYIEDSNSMSKIKNTPFPLEAINLESAGFNRLNRGQADLDYDRSTNNAGTHVFEKMVSGAYLGGLYEEVLRHAHLVGLLDTKSFNTLKGKYPLETKHLSSMLECHVTHVEFEIDKEQYQIMVDLATALVERAAFFSAINISSVSIQSLKKKQSKKIFIAANGSTYEKLPHVKEKIRYYLDRILLDSHDIHYQIKTVEDAPAIGAAIAGLSKLK